MFNAYVLVRNLDSSANQLDFGEFTIQPVGARYQELRELFSSVDVNRDDWIFEKSYNVPPPGPPGSPVGGIPRDLRTSSHPLFGSISLVTFVFDILKTTSTSSRRDDGFCSCHLERSQQLLCPPL